MAGISISIHTDLGTLDTDLGRVGKLTLRGLESSLRDGHRDYLRENSTIRVRSPRTAPMSQGRHPHAGNPRWRGGPPRLRTCIYAYSGDQRDSALTLTLDAPLDGHSNLPREYTHAVAVAGGFWLTTARGIRGLFTDDGNAA
ncbi:hypothetical protein ABIA13_002106 [Sinorhizobium fredii]